MCVAVCCSVYHAFQCVAVQRHLHERGGLCMHVAVCVAGALQCVLQCAAG